MRPRLRLALLFCAVACGGDGIEYDAPLVTVGNGAVRIRCDGGDCDAAIVRDSGFFHVAVSRTAGGTTETEVRMVPTITDVDIETAAGNDRVLLVDTSVPGRLRIATSSGNDSVDLCDTGARGETRIDAGPGNDTVSLEPGFYRRPVQVFLDDGDDDLYVFGGFFADAVRVDGGSGGDSALLSATFRKTPQVTGIEDEASLE